MISAYDFVNWSCSQHLGHVKVVGTLGCNYYQQRILSLMLKEMITCATFKLLSGGDCKGGSGGCGRSGSGGF